MENTKKNEAVLKHRGAIYPEKILPRLKAHDYNWVKEQKMGYYLSYTTEHFQFHAVDRFASFPLFYCVKNGKPYVSEKVDDLLLHLPQVKFDPVGYYGTGGMLKGERSHRTPFVGIERIMPGHYLEYKDGKINLTRYWSFLDLKDKPFQGTYEEACEELGFLVKQAVERCIDFAPETAVHLSGGLDSGTITAITCQLSNQERQAYALLRDNAPLEHDTYESGFIQKYQQEFPQLKVNRFDPTKDEEIEGNLFTAADNWYYISTNNVQCAIAKDVQAKGKKYILTGVGGDELASYGHSYQNVSYSIHNDQQAKLYLKWMIGRKRRWRYRIKGLLGRDGNIIDSFRSTEMNKMVLLNKHWYTKAFVKSASSSFNKADMALYWFPSSYDYRLETLSRSFFTIRSDKWNFIGRHYNVDYLHPLLDSDVVNFSASIPRDFFKGKKHRELIKTALNKQLPKSLLEGGKRPSHPRKQLEVGALKMQIAATKSELTLLKDSFAGNVYDFNKMRKMLNSYEQLMKTIPNTDTQTIVAIKRWASQIDQITIKAKYLNHFF